METEKTNKLTVAGKRKFEAELEHLRVVSRKEIAQKIKEAREQGDLSENAEYDAAKDEQREIEARIAELEAILKNAEVVKYDGKTVGIGCTVKVWDEEFGEEIEFEITGSDEANSRQNKISNESPFGMAISGCKVGDSFTVDAPDGKLNYKVIDIRETL